MRVRACVRARVRVCVCECVCVYVCVCVCAHARTWVPSPADVVEGLQVERECWTAGRCNMTV